MAHYSDRSACNTSTRDTRAAGISDATRVARISTTAAGGDGQRVRQLHGLDETLSDAHERAGAGGDPDRGTQPK